MGIVYGHGFRASFARNPYPSARHPLAGIKTLSVFALGCFSGEAKTGIFYRFLISRQRADCIHPGIELEKFLNTRSLFNCVNLAGLGRTEASE